MAFGKLIALGAVTVGAFALVQIVNKTNPKLGEALKEFNEESKKAQKEAVTKPEVVNASEKLKEQLLYTKDKIVANARCLVCDERSECICKGDSCCDDCPEDLCFDDYADERDCDFFDEEDLDIYSEDDEDEADYDEEDDIDIEYDEDFMENLEAVADEMNKTFNLTDNSELDRF